MPAGLVSLTIASWNESQVFVSSVPAGLGSEIPRDVYMKAKSLFRPRPKRLGPEMCYEIGIIYDSHCYNLRHPRWLPFCADWVGLTRLGGLDVGVVWGGLEVEP